MMQDVEVCTIIHTRELVIGLPSAFPENPLVKIVQGFALRPEDLFLKHSPRKIQITRPKRE